MKTSYIIRSGLAAILVPLIPIFIPIIGIYSIYFFSAPLIFLGGVMGSTQKFVNAGMFSLTPNWAGSLIIFPFWFVFGAICGWIIYSYRQKYYGSRNQPIPKLGFGAVVLIVAVQILGALLFLMLSQPYGTAEQQARDAARVQYEIQNCHTVYTTSYTVQKCPDGLKGSPAALSEYLKENKN